VSLAGGTGIVSGGKINAKSPAFVYLFGTLNYCGATFFLFVRSAYWHVCCNMGHSKQHLLSAGACGKNTTLPNSYK